jgi:hypothetical protein
VTINLNESTNITNFEFSPQRSIDISSYYDDDFELDSTNFPKETNPMSNIYRNQYRPSQLYGVSHRKRRLLSVSSRRGFEDGSQKRNGPGSSLSMEETVDYYSFQTDLSKESLHDDDVSFESHPSSFHDSRIVKEQKLRLHQQKVRVRNNQRAIMYDHLVPEVLHQNIGTNINYKNGNNYNNNSYSHDNDNRAAMKNDSFDFLSPRQPPQNFDDNS